MLSIILLVIFIPVCILLILIVLLQAGKGGGLAGAFGGTGGQTFLGARGTADFLSKMTIYLAIAFMFLSLILSFTYGKQRGIRIQDEIPAVETQTETSDTESPTTQEGTQQDSSAAETPSTEGTE